MRFPVINMDQLSPEQQALVDQISQGPRGGVRGPFLPLLHHPELAMCVQAVGEHLRYRASIDQSLIELAILVTAKRWNCQYEWFAHSRIAHTTTDLPHDVIEAVRQGKSPSSANAHQMLVYELASTLHADGRLSDDLFDSAVQAFGYPGVLDLISTCGYYTTIGMVLNVAQIPLPDDADPQYCLDRPAASIGT